MRRLLVPLAACLLALTLRAQDVPTITVTKSAGQIGLALNPLSGPGGPAATRVLTDDLTAAGTFFFFFVTGSS